MYLQSHDERRGDKWSAFAGFVLTFFPVILAIIAFALEEFWPTWLANRSSAIWAGVLLIFLVELWRSDASRRRAERLLARVSDLVVPDISSHTINEAFDIAFDLRPYPRRIRIFALTSYKIQPAIEKLTRSNVIDNVELLLVNPGIYVDSPTGDIAHESRLAVAWGWLGMVKGRMVRKLELRQYDFYPTEWFVLLDDEICITGSYVFDSENIAKAATAGLALLARNHGAGSAILESTATKFDCLFNECGNGFGASDLYGVIDWEMDLQLGHWPDV